MDNPQSQPRDVQSLGQEPDAVAPVPPLDVTGVRTVTVGTILFLLGALTLLFFRDWMDDTGREWWFWTCVTGFGLGLFGYVYCSRRVSHSSD